MASLWNHDRNGPNFRSMTDCSLLPCIIATVAPGDSHISQPSYRCNFCHYATGDKDLIQLHISDHFFRCKYCLFYTDRQHELLSHYKVRHGKPYSLPYHLISLDEHKMSVSNRWQPMPLVIVDEGRPSRLDSLKYSVPKDGYISHTVISEMEQVEKLGPVKRASAKVSRTAPNLSTSAAFKTSVVADNVTIQCGALATPPVVLKKPKIKAVKPIKVRKAFESQTPSNSTPSEVTVATAMTEPFRIVLPKKMTHSLRLLSAYANSTESEVRAVTSSLATRTSVSEAQSKKKLLCYADTLSKNVVLFCADFLRENCTTLNNRISSISLFKQATALVGHIPHIEASDVASDVKCLVKPTEMYQILKQVNLLELLKPSRAIVGSTRYNYGTISKIITPLEEAECFPSSNITTCQPLFIACLKTPCIDLQLLHGIDSCTSELPLQNFIDNAVLPQSATSSEEHVENIFNKMNALAAAGQQQNRLGSTIIPSIIPSHPVGGSSDIHDYPRSASAVNERESVSRSFGLENMLNDARAPRRSLRFLPSRQAALSSLAKRNTLADITSSDVTSSESAVSQYSPDSLSSLSSETNTELDIRRPRHSLGKGAKKASAQAYRASNTSQSSSLLSNSLVSCSDSSTDPYAFEESCEQLHEEHWNNSRTGSGSCRSSSSGDIDKLQSSNSCLAAFPTKLVTSSLDKQYIQDLGPKKVHPITRERKPFTADSFFSDEEESIATTSSSTALLYAPSTSYPPNMKQGSDVLSEQGKKRVKSNDEKKCREKLSPARRGWRAKTEPSSKQPLRRLPPTPPRPHSSEACADAPTAAPSLIKIAEDKETLNLGKTQPMPEQCQQSDALSRPSIKSRLGPEVNNKDDSISDNEQILTRPKSQRVTRQSSAGHLPEQKRSPLVTRSASLSSLGSPDSSESTAGSLISNQSPSLPASSRLATKRRRSTNTDSQRRRAPTRGLALIRHALSGLMMQPPLPKRARHSVPPVDKGLFTDLSDGDRVPDLLLNLQTRHLSPSPNKQLLRMPEIVEIIEFPQEFISGTIEPIKQILSSQVNLTNDCFLQTKMHTDEIYNTTSNTFLNVGTEHVQMDIAHADFELNQVSLIEESQPLFKAKKLPPTLVCAPKLSIYNQAKRMCPHQTDVVPFQVTPAWKYSPALHRPYSYIISQKYALPVTSQCPPLISANLINLPTFAKAAVESVVCETFEAKKNVLKCTGNSATDMTSSNMDHYVTIDETSDDTDSLPLDMSASFHTLTKTPSHTHMHKSDSEHAGYHLIDKSLTKTPSHTHMHKSDSEHAGYHLIDKSLTKTPSHTHMHKSDSEHAGYHLIDKFKKSESAVADEQWDSDEFLDIIDVDPEESNKKSDDENDDDIKFVEECIGINRRACSEPGHLSSTLTVVQANVAPVVVKVEECATTLQTSISPSKLVSENTRDLGLQLSTQSGPECKSAATSFHSLKSRLQLALQKGALAKKPDTIDGKSVNSSKPKHHRSSSSKNGNDHAKSDPLRSKSKKEKKLKKHKRKHKGSKQELSESKRPSEKPSPVKISHTGNKSCILIQSKSCKKRRREPVSLEDSLIFYPVPSENNDQNKNGCKLATLNNPQKLSKAHPSHVSPELNDTKHANHAKKRKSDSPIEQSKHKKPKPSRNIEGSSSAKSKKRHEEGSSKPHRSKLPWCDRTITDVLRCQRCDFICLEQNDLVEHKQEVHAAKVASLAPCEYDPVVNQNVQYKCTLCGLADDQLKRIRMHITAEHGGKLHSCERVTHTRGENGFSLLVESVRVYKE